MFKAIVLTAMLIQAPGAAPASQLEAALEGEWVVEIVDNIRVMPESAVTVTLRGTRVSGLASCNTYTRIYTAEGTDVKTDSILTTMKACDEARMSQEREFLSLLRSVVRYELRPKDTLLLINAAGKSISARRR